MNHEEIKERLSDYLDGELSVEESASMDTHLQDCSECRAELERYRHIDAVVHVGVKVPTLFETEAFTLALLRRLEPAPEVAFLASFLSSPRWAVPAFALAFATLAMLARPARTKSYGPFDALMIAQDDGRTYAWLSKSPSAAAAGALNMGGR